MRNSHRTFSFVHVLTTCTGGAIHIDTQIGRIDFDINIIVNFRIHKRSTERGMTTVIGVKRAFTHQTVNAGFRA